MALTRRELLTALAGSAALAACARGGTVTNRGGYQELYQTRRRAGAPRVLVCMPETKQTIEAWRGLSDELSQEFELVAVRVDNRGDASIIAQAVERHRPSALVLMNNPTVAAFRAYERTRETGFRVPSVAIMTSFLQEKHLASNETGVAYEIPLITSVTHLRKVMVEHVDRIGVVHGPSLHGFVNLQRELAAREEIHVLAEMVGEAPNESEIKRALRQIKQRVDAVWILNDDRLLTPHLISMGWLPGLNERPWRPAIVGAESLVSADLAFGTFAVLPDHTELGAQAANMVFDIADEGWKLPEGYRMQQPLSTRTILDLAQLNERFRLRPGALAQVDVVLE